jgi:hypothetical protein
MPPPSPDVIDDMPQPVRPLATNPPRQTAAPAWATDLIDAIMLPQFAYRAGTTCTRPANPLGLLARLLVSSRLKLTTATVAGPSGACPGLDLITSEGLE